MIASRLPGTEAVTMSFSVRFQPGAHQKETPESRAGSPQQSQVMDGLSAGFEFQLATGSVSFASCVSLATVTAFRARTEWTSYGAI